MPSERVPPSEVQRTELARRRTALAFAVMAALLVRTGRPAGLFCGALLAAVAVLLYAGRATRPGVLAALTVAAAAAALLTLAGI